MKLKTRSFKITGTQIACEQKLARLTDLQKEDGFSLFKIEKKGVPNGAEYAATYKKSN